jgi:acetoin utilization protein AcuB
MIARELINDMIPPLKLTDEASKALVWMEELRQVMLPVVDNGNFLGFLFEETIIDENDSDKKVSEYYLDGEKCFIYQGQHVFDAIKKASDYEMEAIAILNENGKYVGVMNLADAMELFANSAIIQSKGGVIILSINQVDYSLSEISRLVESNEAQIVGLSINMDLDDPLKYNLTLKINKEDLTHISATLERFGYNIVAKFEEVMTVSNEKERLDMLMRYLDA